MEAHAKKTSKFRLLLEAFAELPPLQAFGTVLSLIILATAVCIFLTHLFLFVWPVLGQILFICLALFFLGFCLYSFAMFCEKFEDKLEHENTKCQALKCTDHEK